MFAALQPDYNPELAHAVASGLKRRQKTIPACWLYDDLGSTLFEAITLLPEYGLTRADGELLRQCSPDVIHAAGNPSLIVELGSGTGTKTKHLLEAAARNKRVRYVPIDISGAALDACEKTLACVSNVRVEPVEATYFEGLRTALSQEPALILFLGSTIGNFTSAERGAFLTQIQRLMNSGDCLLIGTDLVKPADVLIRAYDDSLGVTAAFNRNLLVRINRELGGHFDIASFAHEARYNPAHARIEMHLRSRKAQRVRIDELNLQVSFSEDETIWTESCHKFTPEKVRQLGTRAGFRIGEQWIDETWGFAETLLIA